jgi:hypothetical protein
MGGGPSATRFMDGSLKEIVTILMPAYYIEASITDDDLAIANGTWQHIVADTSPEFISRKQSDPLFPYSTCMNWFFNAFYMRLFDVHPMCRPLFKNGLDTVGKFLIQMVSLCLNQLKKEKVIQF